MGSRLYRLFQRNRTVVKYRGICFLMNESNPAGLKVYIKFPALALIHC